MMEKLKRWWWVVAIVVVVVGLVAYSALGGGSPSAPGSGQLAGGLSGSQTPSGTVGTQTAAPGANGGPSAAPGTAGGSTAPVPVAPEGSKLATVTAIPKNTLARIKFSAARNNQVYDIRFRVYGTGPSVAGHGALVVMIESSTPRVVSSESFKFQGMNALLQLGPKVTVTKGGEYKGVMKLMSQSGGLVPVLTQAKAL